jgi:hypothetical protein
MTGEQLRDAALTLVAESTVDRTEFVKQCGDLFLSILVEQKTATIEDLRDRVQLPAGWNPVIFGAVAKNLASAGKIVSAGYVKSKRPQAHARPVINWALPNEAEQTKPPSRTVLDDIAIRTAQAVRANRIEEMRRSITETEE